MIITITCHLEEFKKIKPLLKGAQVNINIEKEVFSSRREVHDHKKARFNLIKSVLLSGHELRSMSLYRILRRKGYPCKYKTFQRDMKDFSKLGFFSYKIHKGGIHGSTTYWKLKDGEELSKF